MPKNEFFDYITGNEDSDRIGVLFKDIFEKDGQARLLIDSKNGNIIAANIRASSLFGINLENFRNKNVIDILHLNEKELLLELIRVFAGKRDFFVFNLQLNSIEKTTFKVYPSKFDWDNKLLLCLTFFDISKTTENLMTFMQSEEALRFVLNESNDIIFISDSEGNLLDVSMKALELSSCPSREELLKKNFFKDLLVTEHDKNKIMNQIRSKGLCADQEIVFRDNNNRQITLLLTIYSTTNAEKSSADFLIGFARIKDITFTPELQVKAHYLKMEAIQQLTIGMTHEFNNILSGIMGFSDLLNIHIGHNDRAKSYIEKILFSANRGAQLIKDLNIFSQRITSNPALIDINETIIHFKEFVTGISNNITLELELSKEILSVNADFAQIRTILLNLFSNSRDAMPNGGTITIRTELLDIDSSFKKIHGFGIPGRYVLISFTDKGSGIPEEIRDRIFEPFFTTKEVGKGTGLGLSIVYGIVKQHNGYITVTSDQGFTSFKIYLPYCAASSELIDFKQREAPSFGKPDNILIAEGNEVVRVLIKDILEGAGYKVVLAINGEEAAQIIKHNNKIALIIINPLMCIKSGTKVYELIKTIKPDIKMIFLNGDDEDIMSLDLPNEKIRKFIKKPFSVASLLSSVSEFLELEHKQLLH